MPAIAMVIFVLCMIGVLLFLVDSSWKKDFDFAYIEITTSDGTACVDNAFHGNNKQTDALRQAYAIQEPTQISLPDGGTAKIHFHCSQCGYDEMLEEVVAPYAKVFACECSGTLEDGNRKEYIAVVIGDAELEGGTTENVS